MSQYKRGQKVEMTMVGVLELDGPDGDGEVSVYFPELGEDEYDSQYIDASRITRVVTPPLPKLRPGQVWEVETLSGTSPRVVTYKEGAGIGKSAELRVRNPRSNANEQYSLTGERFQERYPSAKLVYDPPRHSSHDS